MNERTTGKSFKVFNKVAKLPNKLVKPKSWHKKADTITNEIEEISFFNRLRSFFVGKHAEQEISHVQVKTRTRDPKGKKLRKIRRRSFIYNNTHHRGHART